MRVNSGFDDTGVEIVEVQQKLYFVRESREEHRRGSLDQSGWWSVRRIDK